MDASQMSLACLLMLHAFSACKLLKLMQPASPSKMPCTCFELNNLTDTLTSQMYHRVVEEAAVDPPLL